MWKENNFKVMVNINRVLQWIKCCFTGHSHPFFNCMRCGAKSPYQLVRDKNGELIRDEDGDPQWKWVGWKW